MRTTAPAPSATDDVVSVQLSCEGATALTLLVGQVVDFCQAVVQRRSVSSVQPLDSTWSVADPTVAGLGTRTFGAGVFLTGVIGLAAGQTVVSASYGEKTGTMPVTVIAEDFLSLDAAAIQGDFRPGTTVNMWGLGPYSVASADSGQLTLSIADQNGVVSTSAPMTAHRGFDLFNLSTTFVVPATSQRLCQTMTLQIGSKTLSSSNPGLCVNVTP